MQPQVISSNRIKTIAYPSSRNSNSGILLDKTNAPPGVKKSNMNHRQFTPAMAHEFRNPLTNIQLSVEMLNSVIEDDKLKVFLGIIMRSSARINDLIIELLKYERDEVQPEKCSAQQLLDEILDLAKDRLDLKNVLVKKNYEEDCELVLNKPEMKIALTNIIVNAIDAMTTGQGQLKLATRSNKNKYAVLIQDNGCGISKENLKHIFDPYFTNKPGGVGIGLTAASSIFLSNNVRVSVESKDGKGTRFILVFDKNT
jgi:signal transduction histidine kinase